MEVRNYLKYLRFINLTRSFIRGNITRREILIGIAVLVAIRIAIYVGFQHL